MRVVIIGGTGHIGSYLTPRLIEAGHEVLCVSRGTKNPYRPHGAWSLVKKVLIDREVEEHASNFGEKIAALDPEIVIDLTCYVLESAIQLTEALKGRVQHILHCGTIWVHGYSLVVPTTEETPRHPFGEYGIRKAAIERYFLGIARTEDVPVTVLHPGHLVGTGWNPINPQANFNPDIFSALATGQPITLPNIGMETVHHVHGDDVARAFLLAMSRRSVAIGEAFHVVSPAAVTLRGFAQHMAMWFGREAKIELQAWERWKDTTSERDAQYTWDHISHSPNCSIAKAQKLLGYWPRYTSFEAVEEAVTDMQRRDVIPAR